MGRRMSKAGRKLVSRPFSQRHALQTPPLRGHDTFEITVYELHDHLSERHFTSVEYVAHCLEQIRVLNPYLEAVIELNPDALAIARRLDEERAAGKERGVLHGIPVLLKDNIATKDLMQTTAGSWALLGSVVPKDAFVVVSGSESSFRALNAPELITSQVAAGMLILHSPDFESAGLSSSARRI